MAASSPWPIIHSERKSLAADLAGLTEEQWNSASLTSGWTIREALAHMTSTATITPGAFFIGFASTGFRFHEVNRRGVAREMGSSPTETLERFEARAEATTHPPGPSETMLGETIVHAEDIRRPLGIDHTYDPEGLMRSASFFAGSNLIVGGKSRVKGLKLSADDSQWSIGEGPEVRGPLLSLLLAVTGRSAGLDQLSGDGLTELRSRF